MREIERVMLLRMVDTKWMDHIDAMEELKKGIALRAMPRRIRWWNTALRLRHVRRDDRFHPGDTVRLCLTIQIRKEEEQA